MTGRKPVANYKGQSKVSKQPFLEVAPLSQSRAQVKKPSRARKTSEHSFLLEVDNLFVVVNRKRVKNLILRIERDTGQVKVSAPWGLSVSAIQSYIRVKKSWIDTKRRQLSTSPQAKAAQATPEQLQVWREQVRTQALDLVSLWEGRMGVKAGKLVFRNMTSRWGSCQPHTGRICLNIRLALYPPPCLEYVVIHELCHLQECGHGPRFQALMDTYMPGWRTYRKLLR